MNYSLVLRVFRRNGFNNAIKINICRILTFCKKNKKYPANLKHQAVIDQIKIFSLDLME